MKGAIMIIEEPARSGRKAVKSLKAKSSKTDFMDAELARFLKRLARNRENDERQLYLPGLAPDNHSS
jgi:hypothetical protein